MKAAVTIFCLGLLSVAPIMRADTLLLTSGTGTSTTSRSAGSGTGTRVAVSTATTISSFDFYSRIATSGDFKFLIFNSTDTNLLFSQTVAVTASDAFAWIGSGPLSFNLDAGQTYYFGVISDQSAQYNYVFPTLSTSTNGLAFSGNNSNYSSFASPVSTGDGGATIALELFGASSTAVTPEPGSLVLLGTGLLGMVGVLRRRLAA